ncbi:uncharacterized protein VTP21DRAFT_7182 [Calcarisporiella thermophila]|uniref:uncharacterized protein n=1 Tax=Calcarisporiella thermophila TaxID=911321 RepID=UPI003743E9BE
MLRALLLALLLLLLSIDTNACERECRNAISIAFAENYSPKIKEEYRELRNELRQFVSVHPQHVLLANSINKVVNSLENNTLSILPKMMDENIFAKYRGHCFWTLGELCGSPVSISYHIQDVLNLTRQAIVRNMTSRAVRGGEYETKLIAAAQEVVGDDRTARLRSGFTASLRRFSEHVLEKFCESGCGDKWIPPIRKILAQFP